MNVAKGLLYGCLKGKKRGDRRHSSCNGRVPGWEEYRLIGNCLSGKAGNSSEPKNAAKLEIQVFFGTTPVLLAVYIVILWNHPSYFMHATPSVIGAGVVMNCASLLIFGFAWNQYLVVKRKWEEIDEKVRIAASR
jgi:hypothetical protein